MPLFSRSHRTPEFVMTDAGWRPFDDVISKAWSQIAALAWEGYQSSGRGFVLMGFDPQRMDYRTITDAQRWLDSDQRVAEFQRHLSRYKPDREVLALVEGCANSAKEARAGAGQSTLLRSPTPPGLPSLPQADKVQRLTNAAREDVPAFRQSRTSSMPSGDRRD